jgi:hypothetical protein
VVGDRPCDVTHRGVHGRLVFSRLRSLAGRRGAGIRVRDFHRSVRWAAFGRGNRSAGAHAQTHLSRRTSADRARWIVSCSTCALSSMRRRDGAARRGVRSPRASNRCKLQEPIAELDATSHPGACRVSNGYPVAFEHQYFSGRLGIQLLGDGLSPVKARRCEPEHTSGVLAVALCAPLLRASPPRATPAAMCPPKKDTASNVWVVGRVECHSNQRTSMGPPAFAGGFFFARTAPGQRHAMRIWRTRAPS